MAVSFLHLLLLLLPLFLAERSPSPYLLPSTFLPNYQKMLKSFKIFAYASPRKDPAALVGASSAAALFLASLLWSSFLTSDPDRAHLFYLSFPSEDPHSIARFLRAVCSKFPFWNRTLGADHFFLSIDGLSIESDRNLVELKKNSIQISPFPVARGRFIPHKFVQRKQVNRTCRLRFHDKTSLAFGNGPMRAKRRKARDKGRKTSFGSDRGEEGERRRDERRGHSEADKRRGIRVRDR